MAPRSLTKRAARCYDAWMSVARLTGTAHYIAQVSVARLTGTALNVAWMSVARLTGTAPYIAQVPAKHFTYRCIDAQVPWLGKASSNQAHVVQMSRQAPWLGKASSNQAFVVRGCAGLQPGACSAHGRSQCGCTWAEVGEDCLQPSGRGDAPKSAPDGPPEMLVSLSGTECAKLNHAACSPPPPEGGSRELTQAAWAEPSSPRTMCAPSVRAPENRR